MAVAYSSKLRWFALIVLLIGQFAISIDMTVVNIALPEITADLKPTADQQLWIIDSYSLVLAGLLFSASSLSDRIGRKKMLLSGTFVFGAASAFVLLAHSAGFVIGIRAAMGVGGAMLMPTTFSMLRSIFENPRERAIAIALWSAIASMGMAAGPVIGGFLLEIFPWQAAFLINVPLAGITFILGIFVLPEVKYGTDKQWDWIAAIISLAGMVFLLWGIKHLAAEMTLFEPTGLIAIAAGIVLLIAFVRRCLHSDHPLVEVRLFRSRCFTGGMLAIIVSMLATAVILLFAPQWLQLIGNFSPLISGLLLVPMAAASFIASIITVRLVRAWGFRTTLTVGLIIPGIGLLLLPIFGHPIVYGILLAALCLVGLGAISMTAGDILIMEEASASQASSAASFSEVSYDLGSVLGVALIGSVATIVYRMVLDTAAFQSLGLTADASAAALSAYASALEVSEELGIEPLASWGAVAFDQSIVVASAVCGILVIIVAIIVNALLKNRSCGPSPDSLHG